MKLLGIDVGTGGTRAVVIDDRGRVVAAATAEHVPFASPQTGWAEQDPLDWWQATQRAVGTVLAHSEVTADEIGGIGLSGQMHGATLLGQAPGTFLFSATTTKRLTEPAFAITSMWVTWPARICSPSITYEQEAIRRR